MAEAAQSLEPVRSQVYLSSARFKGVEFVRRSWYVSPPEGQTLEDVIQPNYWTHVAAKLRTGDHVEVFPDDGAYWAELLVIAVSRVAAKVVVLNFVEIGENVVQPGEVDTTEYEVMWKGPTHKWSIIRLKDGEYVKEQMSSREEGLKELGDYLKALAR